jgi:hypothetical protein
LLRFISNSFFPPITNGESKQKRPRLFSRVLVLYSPEFDVSPSLTRFNLTGTHSLQTQDSSSIISSLASSYSFDFYSIPPVHSITDEPDDSRAFTSQRLLLPTLLSQSRHDDLSILILTSNATSLASKTLELVITGRGEMVGEGVMQTVVFDGDGGGGKGEKVVLFRPLAGVGRREVETFVVLEGLDEVRGVRENEEENEKEKEGLREVAKGEIDLIGHVGSRLIEERVRFRIQVG